MQFRNPCRKYKDVCLLMRAITQAFPSPRGALVGLAAPNKALFGGTTVGYSLHRKAAVLPGQKPSQLLALET